MVIKMAFKKIFCPFCGHETQVDDEKEFCFCLECGNKIQLQTASTLTQNTEEQPIRVAEKTENTGNAFVDEKLKEIAFYYSLSRDKKEDMDIQNEPTYFLKAQDLLIDISQQYPNDYRIWWELCKPLDFYSPLSGVDIHGQFSINEGYFGKALDLAPLDKKRELVDAHDQYISDKKSIASALEAKRREAEAEEERLRQEEAKKREIEQQERELELQKQQQQQEEELQKQQRQQEEELQKQQRQQEEQQGRALAQSQVLWEALANKDYSNIDASYFSFSDEKNQTIIGIFRVVSNILYLMSFRIDSSKGNTLFRDQTITIKFDNSGVAHKFDNSSIKIKGFTPPDNILQVVSDGADGYFVNGMSLKQDTEYVTNIMKSSKKPLILYNKIFL